MSTKRPAARGGDLSSAVSAWPLRRKVALALAVPLLLAGTLGGLRVQADLVEASNSSSSARQVTALRPAVDYLTAAEEAMVAAVGEDSPVPLEKALLEIRAAGDELSDSKESADLTADQRYQVDAVLDLSQALRADDAVTLSPGTWVAQLRQLQSGVTQLITSVVNEQIDPEPRLELLAQTLAGRFSLAMQQALVATERTGETGSLELFSELGVEGAAIDRLASALGTSEKAVASLRTANAQRFRTIRTGGTDLGGAEAYADYDTIISTLQNGIDAELESAAAEARTGALVNAAVTLAALLAAVMLALLVSRMLLNPIQRVREGALAVAHERLPEAVARIRAGEEPGEITPIDVTTEEEIGQLARAVDDMHRQAVVLAAGEAGLRSQVSQMFVTLSRRTTSLINQQLGLIERLERDEEDPKRLESLFRLDHLAARMRRTADSLLILADAPAAAAVVDGLTVSDALQAATSGVLDYQRVRVRSASPVRISGTAAADVVHLLTELVDNALTYSPPGSAVTLSSTTTPEGVLVEVADAGLGIPAEQLARINESLRSGGEVTPDTARRMGLFVVSRLSQRHGLRTTLRAGDDGGTTATVLLPVSLLPELTPPAPSRPRPPERQSRPSTPAPVASQAAAGPRTAERPARRFGRPARRPEPVEATPEAPVEMDIKARIDAALGLPTRGRSADAGSGAPARVTASTASAALAALRPLRRGTAPSPETGGPPAPSEQGDLRSAVEEVVGRVAEPFDGPGDVPMAGAAPEPSSGTPGLPTRRNDAGAEPEPEPEPAEARDGEEPEASAEAGTAAESDAEPDAEPDAARRDAPEPDAELDAAEAPFALEAEAGAPVEPELSDSAEQAVAVEPDAAGRDAPEQAVAVEPDAAGRDAPEPAVAVEPDARTDDAAASPADAPVPVPLRTSGALDGDWTDPGDDGFDTPIFRSLTSAWLSSGDDVTTWRTTEIEAGWEKAEQVAEAPVEPALSQSGLPVRRPGSRLVPGGVTTAPAATVRDPEAVRARLAAHASGVSRGRAAATTAPEPT